MDARPGREAHDESLRQDALEAAGAREDTLDSAPWDGRGARMETTPGDRVILGQNETDGDRLEAESVAAGVLEEAVGP